MSRFIRLTNVLLNTRTIHQINIESDRYVIHVISNHVDGFHWSLAGSGFGNLSTFASKVEVCKTNNPTDYKIVSDWISKHESV
jgi:hypothetical protein